MARKVIIVGGVAGGASAAARLRRLDEHAEIIMFEKGDYISFANCGLPYYIGGTIADKEKLLLLTPEAFRKRFNVDVRVGCEVTKIDRAGKTVEVYDLKKGETYTESYDKLILSPGAEPIKPSLPGIDSSRVFTLRNIPDTYRIKDHVDTRKPKRAVVIGAGFIGLEVAENLFEQGVKTTIVELADHVLGPLDYEMAAIVHQHLKSKEVELYLNDGARSFREADSCIYVELSSGRTIKADMVVLGIGVKPETLLAKNAGITLGPTGGIKTDRYMRTSDPDIYAVGDAVEVMDFVSGKEVLIPLAGPANKQGRIAANNICGAGEEYEGTQGTSIVKVFDITVAITGNNERTLRKNGVDYEKSFTHSASHAGYYPGAIPMSIKLLFSRKDGKVLGAQIVGYKGVDKRIDVIATAIRAGMTVHDLEKLELAYAPPYSSAKDPVNIAGYVASNIIKGDCRVFHWDEVDKIDMSKSVLIDVRTREEYKLGTIEGAINIPLDEIRDRIHEIPKDKDVYLFCRVGLRGYIASRILIQRGFTNVRNLSGGLMTYKPAVDKQGNEGIYEYNRIPGNERTESIGANGEDLFPEADVSVDACGLQCPGPIMQVHNYLKDMKYGEVLKIRATDPAFTQDIKAWCAATGNRLVNIRFEESVITALIKKEKQEENTGHYAGRSDKTMVVFSGDLDRAIAAFIIANGAAAMGRKVTMFFTFWGLNILRKTAKVKVDKDILGKMFGFMMPRGSGKLSLSKMNMGGMGSRMIRFVMKKKNVLSLEELIEQAKANGVNLVACSMSMDIMGIKREELIDGVQTGGVATFLASAERSDMSLFI